MWDLAIIGGGPAALSAGIYAARAGWKTVIYEQKNFGGVLPEISLIENYPGFLGTGAELAEQMRAQAEHCGVTLEYGECTGIATADSGFRLEIDGEEITARAVLIASGSEPKRLPFDLKIPVSYCALCDGALTKGKNVVVVGGANSAAQEALYLAKLAAQVTIVSHSPLKADQELIQRLQQTSNITIVENLEPTAEYLNQFDHCFVYIGKNPATQFLPAEVLDAQGYVITGAGNSPHQTAISGIFAAGDVRSGSTKQIVTAAGDGAMAAMEVGEYLSQLS